MTGLVEAAAFAALDRRLERGAREPVAVAVSGGGDSLALLHLTHDWAMRAGRELHVLTVDHGLNPESARWAAGVCDAAGALGRACDVLRWVGKKPATGLPAAARAARHALLADAARAVGARVVLMGHTANDISEAEVMRAEGSTLGRVREWAPSPAWPEGRGVFVLRPLLELEREALRAWLAARGVGWVEDPANVDPRFGRSRARSLLSSRPERSGEPESTADAGSRISSDELSGMTRGEGGRFGVLRLTREAAAEVWLLAPALVCASGGSNPPRGERLSRLSERLHGSEPVAATLGGARVEAGDMVLIGREAGRRGFAVTEVAAGEIVVWDGRFEVTAAEDGRVGPLAGRAARLSNAERAALKVVPAWVRPTLPVVETGSGAVFCPLLSDPPQARSLVGERWLAACGAFTREQEIPR